MIADVLKGVVNNRMRSYRYNITDNFCAKTGTTNYPSNMWKSYPGLPSDAISDAWVMGFTNKTVISLWYGYNKIDPEHLDRVLHWVPATNERANLFNAIANIGFNHDGTDFEMPSSVVKVGIEAGTNPPLLASPNSPSVIYELFKKGTEPTEVSNRYSQVSAPGNLNLNYKNDKVTLSWGSVSDPGYVNDAVFGYYVYFNDKLLTFTTKTSYTVDKSTNNLSTLLGTYSVKAGYKDTTTSMSSAVSKTLSDTKSYDLSVTTNTTYLKIGEEIEDELFNGDLVVLKEDGKEISDIKKYLTIKVKNSSGDTVSSLSNESVETYTVSYTINYKGFTDTVSNKIIIKES